MKNLLHELTIFLGNIVLNYILTIRGRDLKIQM